jgi:predicted GIY-YIG superfamily endonuclease
MSVKFNQLVAKMPELLKRLESQSFLTRDNLARISKQGIYVFYENNKAIYVGRSNRLKERIQEHGRPSSDHYSATLAFNMAKKEMNASRNKRGLATRNELEKAPGFEKAFFLARKQVAKMQVKVIGIEDQIAQSLFEIYAALTLNTKYNDFSTH